MDKGSKESSPPHNLGRNRVNTYAVRITMLIANIEDDIMDPVMQCTTLPSHSSFYQKKLVSFVTEIHSTTIDFLTPNLNNCFLETVKLCQDDMGQTKSIAINSYETNATASAEQLVQMTSSKSILPFEHISLSYKTRFVANYRQYFPHHVCFCKVKDGVDRKYACLTNQHDETMSPLVLVPMCSDKLDLICLFHSTLLNIVAGLEFDVIDAIEAIRTKRCEELNDGFPGIDDCCKGVLIDGNWLLVEHTSASGFAVSACPFQLLLIDFFLVLLQNVIKACDRRRLQL
ncbi:hypothetical protein Tco_1164749 [Tanacetum coccineum]